MDLTVAAHFSWRMKKACFTLIKIPVYFLHLNH